MLPARFPSRRSRYGRVRLLAITILFVAAVTAVACSRTSITTLGPSVTKCAATAAPPASGLPASGGVSTISVSALPECAWTAATQASWVTDLSPKSGQGSGQIQFRTGPNPTAAARQADILINDVAVRLTQSGAACSFVLTPASLSVGAAATSVNVVVTTADGCGWNAVSSASWIVVTGA